MLTRNCLLLFLWILVDEGSVSSLPRPPAPALGRGRVAGGHARGSAGPMRNGAAGFQRVKRGWVWNQFFVLEEYMGSDPQYVGKCRCNQPCQAMLFVEVSEAGSKGVGGGGGRCRLPS
ncbi:Cadherin-12 [Liparis tanakae]|uniref:Cadherin-12 n=1 Tax=Liparis tanakae TaxID=230148 RepID=A0A4Z2FC03_9TELE|nr:Cadherin-12 [Liparis tanakae]